MSESQAGFTLAAMPAPGNFLGTVSKSGRTGARILSNVKAVSPARSLSSRVREQVNPFEIRYSQPTVSQNFSRGGDIDSLIAGLRSGKIKVGDVPIIRVVEYEGKTFTLDNRRLVAFQNAGIKEIPIQRVSLSDCNIFDEFFDKYNPINNGLNAVIVPKAKFRADAIEILRQYGKIK